MSYLNGGNVTKKEELEFDLDGCIEQARERGLSDVTISKTLREKAREIEPTRTKLVKVKLVDILMAINSKKKLNGQDPYELLKQVKKDEYEFKFR